MVAELKASTPEELVDILATCDRLRVSSGASHDEFRRPIPEGVGRLKVELSGIVRHDVNDQVVVLRANTPVSDLQTALAEHSQVMPYLPFYASKNGDLSTVGGTVAGHLSMNLPHAFAASFGSWKEWLLGAKVVLADGLIAKCGSQVVKSVAGYDIHKFLIGARGTMAIITELTLRTFPLKALPPPDLQVVRDAMPPRGLIQRTLTSDFLQLREAAGSDLVALHPASSVLFRSWGAGLPLPDPGEGWQVGWGLGNENIVLSDAVTRRFLGAAKARFDPSGKLNPGEFGGF